MHCFIMVPFATYQAHYNVFSNIISVRAPGSNSSGFASGRIHSFTRCSGIIRGILSWMNCISSPGSLVRTTNTGRPSSIRYKPHSQVIAASFGWIMYLSPVCILPSFPRKCSHSKYQDAGTIQRFLLQASLNIGFTAAVSLRAFMSNDLPENPHFIGYTVRIPFLFGAITGTTSVGRTSPDVMIPVVFCHRRTSGERFISSTMGRSSGDSSIQYLQHTVCHLT